LVLLPGLLLDERLWARQVAALAEVAEVTVGDITQGADIDAIAGRVLAQAPPRFALAGLSMGGYVAQAIIRLAPERVSHLALLATSARADTRAQTARRRALLCLAERGRFKGVTPRLLPFYVHPDRVDDPAVAGPVLAMAETLGRDVFLRQTRAAMARVDGRVALSLVACPTLVLCGREDQATPLELSREMAALIPAADLVVLGRCGHLAPLERPEAVTAQLRYWLGRA